MRIMILDDSPLRLNAFCRRFGSKYDVRVASTAKDAIELLDNEYFDIIYLDHDLGGKPPEYYGQDCDPQHPNTGSEVIRWMIKNPRAYNVVVHSRNSAVVPGMISNLQTIPGTIATNVPFHDLAYAWGEHGIW